MLRASNESASCIDVFRAGGEALSPVPLQAAIGNLLDLHESQILPALKQSVSNGGTVDPEVLNTLEGNLQKQHFLLPGVDKPTLADLCIGIDLLSYLDVGALPGPVAAFSEVCFVPGACMPTSPQLIRRCAPTPSNSSLS